MSFKRVYHPTADAFKDVPEADVDRWAEAGWRKTKPKHVDDSAALPVGTFSTAAVALEPAEEPPAPVEQKAHKSA